MLYIFDWDGTLADSRGHIVAALQATISQMGLASRTDNACASIIGLGLREAVAVLYPKLHDDEVELFCHGYSQNFIQLERESFPLALFDNAANTLDVLLSRGHSLAIATGKSRRGLDRVLDKLQISDKFVVSRAADETASKPNPKMLHEILQVTGARVEQAVMIGDSSYDMAMAQQLAMPRIAATYGVHDRQQLEAYHPIFFIDAIDHLLHW